MTSQLRVMNTRMVTFTKAAASETTRGRYGNGRSGNSRVLTLAMNVGKSKFGFLQLCEEMESFLR